MVFATLLPLGVLQLWHSVSQGYYEARTLGYITQPGNAVLEWMRMPGDIIFLVGGVLPFLWITWLGVRYTLPATATKMEPETLFVVEHDQAREDRTGVVTISGPAGPAGSGSAGSGSAGPGATRPSPYASDRRVDRDERTDPDDEFPDRRLR